MKILIVRVGQLGDMVMLTPAAMRLLEKFPDARITLLTSRDGKRVFSRFNERFTDTWIYDRRAWFPFLIRRRLRRQIGEAGFDHIYCFETNPSYLRLFRSSAAAVHVLPAEVGPVSHFALRCLRLVDADLESRPSTYVQLPVQEDARKRAKAIFAEHGIGDSTFVVGFHPSFSVIAKRFGRAQDVQRHKLWPVQHWAALAEQLNGYGERQGLDLRVVMDLAPEDRELGEAIVAASGGRVTMMMPPLDFERYKATLQRMNLLVAPDTGPMHLAAAVRCNLVALFSGKDPADCGPFGPPERHVVVRAAPSSSLAAIDPETVFRACVRFLPSGNLAQ